MKAKFSVLFIAICLGTTTGLFTDVTQCYTANGIDYEGNQSQLEPPLMHQSNFTPCMMWNQTGLSEFQDLPENFCRNANNSVFPWCFVKAADGQARASLCDIPTCRTPAYIGCFRRTIGPNSTALMNGKHFRLNDAKMKIARCLNFCRRRKYAYAGLTDGHSCYCSKWASSEEADFALSDENRLPNLQCREAVCASDPVHACGGKNASAVYDTRAGSCKATYYNVARGTIYSPRWPGRYQHNLSCSWRIFVPKKYLGKSNSLVFSFTYFDLEPVKDNLTIYTFESLVDTKPTKIVSLHGSEPQSDVEIPLKNAMYVFLQFDSDGQKAHYGFTITFKVKRRSAITGNFTYIQGTRNPESTASSGYFVTTGQQTRLQEKLTTLKQEPILTEVATISSATTTTIGPGGGKVNHASNSIKTVDIIIVGITCGAVAVVTISLAFLLARRRNKKIPNERSPPEFKNPVSFNNGSSTVSIA